MPRYKIYSVKSSIDTVLTLISETGENNNTKKRYRETSNASTSLVKFRKMNEDMKNDRKSIKWKYLKNNGPMFPPDYEKLPDDVKLIYGDQEIKLSLAAEEVACFYAKMLGTKYTKKVIFNRNFFTDWRNVMSNDERKRIITLDECNFSHIKTHLENVKNTDREREREMQNKYGYCIIRVGNGWERREEQCKYKIEPPGLFRGLGRNPNMGKLKKRVMPEDVIINCSRNSVVPEPPSGHYWKEVIHNDTVSWLASWVGKVSGKIKYLELDPSSKLKGEKDKQKYDTAKLLHRSIDKIRVKYTEDSKNINNSVKQRQLAVATYLIDKLALRAGNEKKSYQADTFGCCSLRVEHVKLHHIKNHMKYVLELDFISKSSIPYHVEVSVEPHIFKNLSLFKSDKKESDRLFDKIDTIFLNGYLRKCMPNLTAKVFRTYNASMKLQQKLNTSILSKIRNCSDKDQELEKIKFYLQANREVAVLCNHKKTKKKRQSNEDQAEESDNKEDSLITSQRHYNDPRITVAWCHKHRVPIAKIYTEELIKKFKWAIDLKDYNYVFG